MPDAPAVAGHDAWQALGLPGVFGIAHPFIRRVLKLMRRTTINSGGR